MNYPSFNLLGITKSFPCFSSFLFNIVSRLLKSNLFYKGWVRFSESISHYIFYREQITWNIFLHSTHLGSVWYRGLYLHGCPKVILSICYVLAHLKVLIPLTEIFEGNLSLGPVLGKIGTRMNFYFMQHLSNTPLRDIPQRQEFQEKCSLWPFP